MGNKSKQCVNPECHNEVTKHDKIDFIVSDSHKFPDQDQPFIVGHQTHRYHIRGQKYIDSTRKGITYKDPTLYQDMKLLLQKTGHGIKAVIDYKNRWVIQVVYMFKLKERTPVSLEYILGVVNSTLIHKYFYLEVADPFQKEFPHFTQKKFLQLPIKIPTTEDELFLAYQISKKAKLLQTLHQKKYFLNQKRSKSRNSPQVEINKQINELETEVDGLVMEMYRIPSEQRKFVISDIF